jgi:hypothetical protein
MKHSAVTTLTSNNSVELSSRAHKLSKFYETRKLVAVFTAALLTVPHQIHPLYLLLPYFFKVTLIYFICCISFWNSALSREVSANGGFLRDKAAVPDPATWRPCAVLPYSLISAVNFCRVFYQTLCGLALLSPMSAHPPPIWHLP